MIVGLDLPGFAADLNDPLDDRTAGRRRVIDAGRWGNRRPLTRRDDRAGSFGKDSLVAAKAVVCLIGLDLFQRPVDPRQQLWQNRPVMHIA